MKETLTIKISSSMKGVNESILTLVIEDDVLINIHVESDKSVLESESSAVYLIESFIDAAKGA